MDAPYVRYHGPKYGAGKKVFWNDADIFVFPTYYYNECFPLVLLEAMQHGIACVSTDEGGVPDIIENGQTGFISRRQDAEDLANKLELIIKDRIICKKFGKAGKERYEQLFTLECFERTMLECLKSCIE